MRVRERRKHWKGNTGHRWPNLEYHAAPASVVLDLLDNALMRYSTHANDLSITMVPPESHGILSMSHTLPPNRSPSFESRTSSRTERGMCSSEPPMFNPV